MKMGLSENMDPGAVHKTRKKCAGLMLDTPVGGWNII